MPLLPSQLYHCYNQGNNRETIFKCHEDYLLFLTLVRKHIRPACDILAWCLMPNHFHFLLHTNLCSVQPIQIGNIESQLLNDNIRKLLSKYAQTFNNQNGRSGSLFRQKTKFKGITLNDPKYETGVLDYIHYNPVAAGLIKQPTDWLYSSALEYAGLRNGTLINLGAAKKILQL